MKKLTIRIFSMVLALVMVLPIMPIFAEETTTAANETTPVESGSESVADSGSQEESTTASPDDVVPTPGGSKDELPKYDEGFESIPDTFEFDDNLVYLAYKNTTTYSLVRSAKAMILVKAKLLEIQETLMKLTAEDPDIVLGLTPDLQEEYGGRMGAYFPLVEDASHMTKNEIIVGQYDWDTQKDLIGRSDVSKMAKELITSASDFFIHVTEDGDVWVVGGANTTTVIAFDFMVDRILKIDREQRYIAIEKGLTYVYHHEQRDDIPFVINNKGENEFEFTLQAYSMEKDVFCRLTYNGTKGWRLQDKQVYSADYNNLGASQLLAATVGEDTSYRPEKLTYSENGNQLTITAPDGSYAVVDTTNGAIAFYTASGKLAQKLLGATHTVYHGTHTVTARFEISKNDVIYGSGGQFKDLNLNGQLLTLYSNNIADNTSSVYSVVPLFINTKGSAVFMNRNEYMTVDIGKTNEKELVFSVINGSLDCYIFTTETVADAITEYSRISGFASMPADWSYGMLVCRYNKEFTKLDNVYEMVAKMEQYGLAWSGVILEDWSPYNTDMHDDLKELCDYLHSMGKKVIIYLRTGDLPEPHKYANYLVTYTAYGAKTPSSRVFSNVNGEYLDDKDVAQINASTPYYYLDVSNPEAVKWFFDEYWSVLLNDIGIDGAKLDLGGLIVDTVGTLNFYDANMATAGAHHWYATSFNTLLWEAISSKPDSGICYINCAGIGAQRAPYMWAGDQTRVKNRLQRQLTYVLTSGLSGIPFVSYDIGTSTYKDNEMMDIEDDAEFFLRAVQMTAFMPSMQTSGTVRRPYDFAEYVDAKGKNSFAYVTQLYKLYTKLHESLIPYIQECSQTATETGMPVVRQLILNYANDANVYKIKDQYMLGDAFLVAPEVELKTKRDIYLPEGEWIDLNTGETIKVPAGGQTVEDYKVTMGQVAVFYNKNTTSTVAVEVLASVQNVMAAIKNVDIK